MADEPRTERDEAPDTSGLDRITVPSATVETTNSIAHLAAVAAVRKALDYDLTRAQPLAREPAVTPVDEPAPTHAVADLAAEPIARPAEQTLTLAAAPVSIRPSPQITDARLHSGFLNPAPAQPAITPKADAPDRPAASIPPNPPVIIDSPGSGPRSHPQAVTAGPVYAPTLEPPPVPRTANQLAPATITGVPDIRQQKQSRPWRTWLRLVLKTGAFVVAGYAAICILLLAAYRVINPPTSTLMLWQRLGGTSIDQEWVPLERISPNLIRAVIASEDSRFCSHNGVDMQEIRRAIKRARNGTPRGASTISMQVTKNLLLWNSKSYIRKAIEIPLTLLMEVMWPKKRVLEVYLNIAEWGDGVFGAEAAAGYHFDKSARRLTLRQASLLAVALPSPLAREAGNPGRKTRALAGRIVKRVRQNTGVARCVLPGGA